MVVVFTIYYAYRYWKNRPEQKRVEEATLADEEIRSPKDHDFALLPRDDNENPGDQGSQWPPQERDPPPSPPSPDEPHSSPQQDPWADPFISSSSIPMTNLFATLLIRTSDSGGVFRGFYDDQPVEVKKLNWSRTDRKKADLVLAQVKILASIKHERVVKFFGISWKHRQQEVWIVTEQMEGGDLQTLLQSCSTEKRPKGFEGDKIKIALHVVQALSHLHSLAPPVLHRNLTSRSIRLTPELDAKITDFGVKIDSSSSLWLAPEVVRGERYTTAADMFSFGIVMTELESHQLPYAGHRNLQSVPKLVAKGKLRAQFSARVPEWVKSFGEQCLALDPKERPTAGNIVDVLDLAMQLEPAPLPGYRPPRVVPPRSEQITVPSAGPAGGLFTRSMASDSWSRSHYYAPSVSYAAPAPAPVQQPAQYANR